MDTNICYICGDTATTVALVHIEGIHVMKATLGKHDNVRHIPVCKDHKTMLNNTDESLVVTTKENTMEDNRIKNCVMHMPIGATDNDYVQSTKKECRVTCVAITEAGTKCKHHGTIEFDDGGWFCGQHGTADGQSRLFFPKEKTEVPAVSETKPDGWSYCGNCHGYHADSNAVRICYGHPAIVRKAPASKGRYLSDEEKAPYLGAGDRFINTTDVKKISNPYKNR